MALVSVTEAARLAGKNRATIHRYIKQGKLSQSTDATGSKKVETSELLRVFGTISASPTTVLQRDVIQHDATIENVLPVAALQQKIALLEQLQKPFRFFHKCFHGFASLIPYGVYI